MRLAEPITFAVIVLALFVAPAASAGAGPADSVGASSLGQDDDTNETTEEEMMSDCETTEMMGETTEGMDGGMDNESMGDETTEEMDADMGNESMDDETTTMDCPTTESMDDDMDDTTDSMDDDMSDGTTTDEMSDDEMGDTTDEMMDDTTDEGGSAFAPGFGPVVAVVALIGAALYAVRRE